MIRTRFREIAMALLWAVPLVAGSGGRVTAVQPAAASIGTPEQLEAGRTAYRTHCATCHAGDLGGTGETPPLSSDAFLEAWRTRTTADFYQYIQGMPPEGPKPSADEYVTIVVYILQRNGGTVGQVTLTPADTTSIGAVVPGRPTAR